MSFMSTWDGLPVSPDPPTGATIAVYRHTAAGAVELLLLHRRHVPHDTADWAWGPPSGGRLPGEDPDVTARRELAEETGLALNPTAVIGPFDDWRAYAVEVDADTRITLSPEHDRYEWLPVSAAIDRASPEIVRQQLRTVLRTLGLRSG